MGKIYWTKMVREAIAEAQKAGYDTSHFEPWLWKYVSLTPGLMKPKLRPAGKI